MQTLKLADDLFEALRTGNKFTTIRNGRRDVALGELLFEGAEDGSLQETVTVTQVAYTTLGGVAQDTLEDDGFKDHDDALAAMQRFYPGITLESEVTSVSFFPHCLQEDV